MGFVVGNMSHEVQKLFYSHHMILALNVLVAYLEFVYNNGYKFSLVLPQIKVSGNFYILRKLKKSSRRLTKTQTCLTREQHRGPT